MYSKQEAAQLKQEFWTAFGLYMLPILSADGEKINWLNYKTGEKYIYFRMDADNKLATIAIEITHKEVGLQALYFEQFKQLQAMLYNEIDEAWVWQQHVRDEHGKLISRIYKQLPGVSVFKKSDWPQIISFLKLRIIALDVFWSNAKHAFEALR